MTFSELNLDPKILKAIDETGYTSPTPIQAEAIPPSLEGKDVLGIAQTGTGKTAAFSIPMINRLIKGRARARMPRTLVLAPTRELAAQVAENFETYSKHVKLSMALLIGGVSFKEQDQKIPRYRAYLQNDAVHAPNVVLLGNHAARNHAPDARIPVQSGSCRGCSRFIGQRNDYPRASFCWCWTQRRLAESQTGCLACDTQRRGRRGYERDHLLQSQTRYWRAGKVAAKARLLSWIATRGSRPTRSDGDAG